MRFFDLLIMSINNLRRRKLRTGLTVLGVVIGTASIVVMVSLGIGLKENTVESYASFGSLTRIQISSGYGNQSEDDYLVDATVTKHSIWSMVIEQNLPGSAARGGKNGGKPELCYKYNILRKGENQGVYCG